MKMLSHPIWKSLESIPLGQGVATFCHCSLEFAVWPLPTGYRSLPLPHHFKGRAKATFSRGRGSEMSYPLCSSLGVDALAQEIGYPRDKSLHFVSSN